MSFWPQAVALPNSLHNLRPGKVLLSDRISPKLTLDRPTGPGTHCKEAKVSRPTATESVPKVGRGVPTAPPRVCRIRVPIVPDGSFVELHSGRDRLWSGHNNP